MDIENIVSNGGSSIIPVEIADTDEHNGCKFLGSEPAGNDTAKCHKNIKIWESKIYGVPKRRRFSAIRDFPSGCGPHAANVNKLECTEDTASPRVKFSLNEKGVSIEDNSPSENMQVKGDAKIEVEHFNKFRDLPMDKIVDGDLRPAKDTNRLEESKDNNHNTNANAVVQPQPSSFDSLQTDRNTSAFQVFPMNCGNNVLKMNADGPAKSILSLADKMSVNELKPALQREPLIRSHSSSPDSLKTDRNVCAFQDITLGYGSDAFNVNTEDPTQRVSSLVDKMSCDNLKLVVGKEPFLENTNMDIELMLGNM